MDDVGDDRTAAEGVMIKLDDNFYRNCIGVGRKSNMSNKDIVNLVSCIDTEGGNVPKSYATIFKRSGIVQKYHLYKLCPECRCIYTEKEAAGNVRCGSIVRRLRRREPCMAPLNQALTMPYRPIVSWVEDLISSYGTENFISECNKWRHRVSEDGVYGDWFDGGRFKEERDWITDAGYDLNLCLLINIDWWQPFKRTIHSMGAIYGSILNLPRDIRQKLDNIMTLAIIPGPKEPSTDKMNSVLRPLIDYENSLQFQYKTQAMIINDKKTMKKIDESAQSTSSKPVSGSGANYTGKLKDMDVDKLDLPKLKLSLPDVEIRRVCEVRTVVTTWKEKVKTGDIIETKDKEHHKVTKVLIINNSLAIIESKVFESRVLVGADAKCGPLYRRLGVSRHYLSLSSFMYKLKLITKGPNFLLLPGRRRICH